MTTRESFDRELAALRTLRDEIQLKIHLASSEVSAAWAGLEERWLQLEDKAKHVAEAAEQSTSNVAEATRLLLGELQHGYQTIRSSI